MWCYSHDYKHLSKSIGLHTYQKKNLYICVCVYMWTNNELRNDKRWILTYIPELIINEWINHLYPSAIYAIQMVGPTEPPFTGTECQDFTSIPSEGKGWWSQHIIALSKLLTLKNQFNFPKPWTFYIIFNIFYWLYDYSCPISFSFIFPSTLHPPHQPSPTLVHVHGSYM